MKSETKIQLIVGIALGLLILLVIYAALSVQSFTDTPTNPKHEIDIDVEISSEEKAVSVEIKQPSLNFGNYTIIVGNDLSDLANATIFKNLTQIGFKGDIVSLTSPGFNPVSGDTVEVAIYFHEDGGGVRIWKKNIKVF